MDIAERNRLVEENRALVYFTLKRYFAFRAGDDDWIQEGYLALMKAAETFRPELGNKFSTYATKCIWTAMMRMLRPSRQQDFEERATNFIENKDLREPVVYDDPAVEVEANDHHADGMARATQLLKKLTPRERAIFDMRIVQGATLQETGDKFGVCKERVRQIVAVALERIAPEKYGTEFRDARNRRRRRVRQSKKKPPTGRKRGRPRKDAQHEVAISRRRAV